MMEFCIEPHLTAFLVVIPSCIKLSIRNHFPRSGIHTTGLTLLRVLFENIFVCPHSGETFMFHTSSLMGQTVSLSTLLLYFTVSWFLSLLLRSCSQSFSCKWSVLSLELLWRSSLLFCNFIVLCLDIDFPPPLRICLTF